MSDDSLTDIVTRPRAFTPVSAHFTLEEFACHDGTPYPIDQIDEDDPARRTWYETRLGPLVMTLEAIREAAGKPVIIDSGYRTLAYDQKLYERSQASGGGANDKAPPNHSQHPKGRAADIRVGSLTPLELRALIGNLYMAGHLPYLGGLGLYTSFVHVDVRKRIGNHLAMWGGRRLSNIP